MSPKGRSVRFNQSPLALALATALLLPAGTVRAQSTDAQTADKAAQELDKQAAAQKKNDESASSDTTTLDKVTVTGSRIARDTFNSPSPVQVITREESTVAGFNSTAGVLQSNSVTGGTAQIDNSFTGFLVDGGPGVNTLSLRGLGATRTLVLLNGRRISPAGSGGSVGATDLNTLPNIAIDHIEILKDGASSIYGSDAVAGVVNIITRQKVDGAEAEFQQNATEHGGGNETRWSALAGATGDRWRISGSLELYERQELTLGQRDWASKCPHPLVGRNDDGSYGANDYIDPATGEPKCWGLDAGGVTINTLGTAYLLGRAGEGNKGYFGTYAPEYLPYFAPYDYFNRWRPNPAITDGDLPGYEGVDIYGRTTFDPRMKKASLISPTTNITGFLQGGFDLNALGDAELYWEVLASRRDSRQNDYRQYILDYPVGSPLLGDLSWLPAFLAAPADGSTNGQNVAARAFIGWGNYASWQRVDFYRATAGLRGHLSSEWDYDFTLSYARSDADYSSQQFLIDHMARSLDVVSDGAGGFACADPTGGCVAAPVLSTDVIAGNLPQDYRDWVLGVATGNTVYSEATATFGVNGPLFDLPDGTAKGAFGLEYRRAEIDDEPSIESINQNLYNYSSAAVTKGSDSVKEAYAEIELPLLADLPAAKELTVNLSGRYTDYASYGNDTTWKAGLLYTPVSWLSLRASRGTSYRAPALFEQYVGATSGFLSSTADPCNNWGSATGNLRANCAATIGEDLPNFTQKNSVAVYTQGGAESGLVAETSDALTAGIVLQPEFPEWFGDLSFAADYYSIEVDNEVSLLGGSYVLNACYGSNPSDFAAGNGFCNLVSRDPDNSLNVINAYVNVAIQRVRGWDFNLRYTRDIGPGTLRVNAAVTHFLEQSGKTFPDDPIRNYNGTLGSPEYTGQLDATYGYHNWELRYGLDWVGAIDGYDYYKKYYGEDYKYNDTNSDGQGYLLETDDYFLHSLSVRYKGDDWSVTAGIRNLTDKNPPTITAGGGTTYASPGGTTIGNALLYSGFDYYGRSYFINFSKKF